MKKGIQKAIVVLLAVVMSVTFLVPGSNAKAASNNVAEGYNEFNAWSPTLNELKSNAQQVELLKTYQAKLGSGDIRYYKLKINKKGDYRITYNSKDLQGHVKFYLFDKKLVRHDSDVYVWRPDDQKVLRRIFSAGEYYLVFRSKDGAGTFDFKVEYDTIPKLKAQQGGGNLVLLKGQKKRLRVIQNVEYPTWSVVDSSVASVVTKGVGSAEVTGRKYGTTYVNAYVDGKNLKCKVQVADPKLSKTSLKLKVKKSYQLKVKQGVGKVTWTSSKRNVARVMTNGKVVARKKGTTYITARCNGKKMKCKVTVK